MNKFISNVLKWIIIMTPSFGPRLSGPVLRRVRCWSGMHGYEYGSLKYLDITEGSTQTKFCNN